ncbi:MAG: tRNA guanosine(34) transglycosylase Tgt [Endomicrobiia bacterium]
MTNFNILYKDEKTFARVTEVKTRHGTFLTPLFLPVGTLGVVKTLTYDELKVIDVEAFITNTYHLYFRPGVDVLKQFNGLHRFINWERVIFSDSGGFQVYSLRDLKKITEEGVEFKSHLDGTTHFFTPEKVVDLQKVIGADIIHCLDECVEYPTEYEYAKKSVELTTLWAQRTKKQFMVDNLEFSKNSEQKTVNNRQLLFGIIQGSMFKDLRKQSLEQIVEIGFDGYSVGGLSVGEPRSLMYEIVRFLAELLPEDKPRYIMGIGEIEDVWECIENGLDIMDCVLPTRNGRNGQAVTSYGKINIKNARYRNDDTKLDSECKCEVCQNYSRGLIHHYFRSGELLGMRLLSYHNVYFMINMFKTIREAIKNKNFLNAKKDFFKKYTQEEILVQS